ncbi:MAG: hypothetical protein Q4Q07_03825 [Tissierellia bacterium]|nr:hypothetical protein [Tissierellia bacterium]
MKKLKLLGVLCFVGILLIGCGGNTKETGVNNQSENTVENKEETNVSKESSEVDPEGNHKDENMDQEDGGNNQLEMEVPVEPPLKKDPEAVVMTKLDEGDQIIFVKNEAPHIILVKLKLTDPSRGEEVGREILTELQSLGQWNKGKVIVEGSGEYFKDF